MSAIETPAESLAARDLNLYAEEFPGEIPDRGWFTTAFEYERDPGCDFDEYWDAVQRLAGKL